MLLLLVFDSCWRPVGASFIIARVKLFLIKLSLLTLGLLDRGKTSCNTSHLRCWFLCISAVAEQVVLIVKAILFDCIARRPSVFTLYWRGRTANFIIRETFPSIATRVRHR